MARIVVTGGSGFIGINLIRSLVAQGHTVTNFDVKPSPDPEHSAHWQPIDLLERRALHAAIASFEPELVYHMAARTDLDGTTLDDYAANTDGLRNLIDGMRTVDTVKRVLFASSRLVCKIGYQPRGALDYCPTTVYGESKVIGEQILHALPATGFVWGIVRPTSIWGPWFDVPYRNFFDLVASGRYVHPRGARIEKSFGYVGNAVHQLTGIMDAMSSNPDAVHRQMFYLADYVPLEVFAWAEQIRSELGSQPVRQVPWGLLKIAALGGDALKRIGVGFPLNSFRLANLMTTMLHDTSNLEALVPSLPFAVNEGVQRTVEWLQGPYGLRH